MGAPSPDDFSLTVEDGAARTGPQGGTRPPAGAPVRSHLPDGTVVAWHPPEPAASLDPKTPVRHAVDAEYADQPLPPGLVARFGTDDFWTRWTRAEVCAKLSDTPILLWLGTHGLPGDPAAGTGQRVHTLDLAGPGGRTIRVSVGTAPDSADRLSR